MAEMKRCEQCGKFYNQEKEAACPHCSGEVVAAVDKTLPVMTGAVASVDKTVPTAGVARAASDDERTMPVFRMETGIDPVVGWLVCLSGSEMGRDFKVHSDNNYIGRSFLSNLCKKKRIAHIIGYSLRFFRCIVMCKYYCVLF